MAGRNEQRTCETAATPRWDCSSTGSTEISEGLSVVSEEMEMNRKTECYICGVIGDDVMGHECDEAVAVAMKRIQIAWLVEKLPHDEDCASLSSGWAAGLEVRPGDMDCNCPHADIMALLRETVR